MDASQSDEFYRQEAALLGGFVLPAAAPRPRFQERLEEADMRYARQLQAELLSQDQSEEDARYARQLQEEILDEERRIRDARLQEDEAARVPMVRRQTRDILLRDDARPDDVQQGSEIGSCWLLSTVSALVCVSGALKRIFVGERRQHEIKVKLFDQGLARTLTVDPSAFPRGVSSCRRNQLFAPVIEKAVAQLRGGYDKLNGGRCIDALEMLTGCPCEELELENEVDDNELWARLLSAHEAGFVLCVSTKQAQLTSDLAPSHAYAIISITELFEPPPPLGSGTRHRVLRLANPHGPHSRYSWQGEWSDQSSSWKTPEMRQAALGRNHSKTSSSSIATFFISLADIRRHFARLSICEYRPQWFEHRLTLHHGEEENIYCLQNNTSLDTSSIEATVQVFARGDAGVLVLRDSKIVASAPVACDRTNPCHVHLSPSNDLLLIPLSFNQQSVKNLVVRSAKPLQISQRPPLHPSFRRNAILSYSRSATTESIGSGMALVHTRTDTAACFFAVDNNHPQASLLVTFTLLHIQGLTLSRRRQTNPHDSYQQQTNAQTALVSSTIPPGHTALILVLAAYTKSFAYSIEKQFQFLPVLPRFASFLLPSSQARHLYNEEEFEPPLLRAPPTSGARRNGGGSSWSSAQESWSDDIHAPVPLRHLN